MWGVTVSVRDGQPPKVGDHITVRADNGTSWTAPISYIHSFNPNTGRAVVVTPNRKDNPLNT